MFPALPSPRRLRNPRRWDCRDGERWQNRGAGTQGCWAGAGLVPRGGRVGGWQGPAGASRSVLAELHRFYSLEPPRLRTGGGAGRRARHPAVTQEPELQHFGQRLSGVHHCKLYLQLTGASRWFFQLISVKAGSDPESIKERYRSQMQ